MHDQRAGAGAVTAFRQARAAATKALTLDDSLGEAHTSLAFALDLYGWDWQAAEKEYEQAIKLTPGYSTLHLWYAWHLMVVGRTSEGILELRKAESLDPLSLIVGADLADACALLDSTTNPWSRAGKRSSWTQILPSATMSWARRSYKSREPMKRSSNFRRR